MASIKGEDSLSDKEIERKPSKSLVPSGLLFSFWLLHEEAVDPFDSNSALHWAPDLRKLYLIDYWRGIRSRCTIPIHWWSERSRDTVRCKGVASEKCIVTTKPGRMQAGGPRPIESRSSLFLTWSEGRRFNQKRVSTPFFKERLRWERSRPLTKTTQAWLDHWFRGRGKKEKGEVTSVKHGVITMDSFVFKLNHFLEG